MQCTNANQENANNFVLLRKILFHKCTTRGKISFVTVNLVEEDFYDEFYDHYHFHIPLVGGTTGDEFAIWEKQIYDRIVKSQANHLFL